MARRYRGVLFDLFGTLIAFDRERLPEAPIRGELRPHDRGRPRARLGALRSRGEPRAVSRGALHGERGDESRAARRLRRAPVPRAIPPCARACRLPGPVQAEASAALSRAHMTLIAGATVLPDGHAALLAALRPHYRLGLVSNFDDSAAAYGILLRHGLSATPRGDRRLGGGRPAQAASGPAPRRPRRARPRTGRGALRRRHLGRGHRRRACGGCRRGVDRCPRPGRPGRGHAAALRPARVDRAGCDRSDETRARPRRRCQIAVAGGGVCSAATARLAHAVGRDVALAGAVLVCGGLGGVMDAAARGAAEADGDVVGLLPGYRRADANPYCSIVLPTGLGHARNTLVAAGRRRAHRAARGRGHARGSRPGRRSRPPGRRGGRMAWAPWRRARADATRGRGARAQACRTPAYAASSASRLRLTRRGSSGSAAPAATASGRGGGCTAPRGARPAAAGRGACTLRSPAACPC